MRIFDNEYLQALANGDPLVENDLILTFTKPLQMRLWAHLFFPQAVEDACQEVMLRVFTHFRSGKTLRNPASLPGFIFAVCDNVVLETIRAHKRDGQNSELLSILMDDRPDPENETIATERRQNLLRVLAELNSKDQDLLWRVCLNEEDRNTVCESYQVTRDQLRLLLYRARARFRALAGKIENAAFRTGTAHIANSA
jgi:RNA polymerase sigma factor (sigma-70 family)